MDMKRLETVTINLYSGDKFPSFSVFLQDIFLQLIVPSDIRTDLLIAYAIVVNATSPSNPASAVPFVGFEASMLQSEKTATFDRLQVVGKAGSYYLRILPRINFDPLVIKAQMNFTLNACESPRIQQSVGNEPYPRCVYRESLLDMFPKEIL
jgi:hypothetical protein